MDQLDREILNALQAGIPVVASPYEEIAARCGTTPEETLSRVQRMRSEGIIRRFGAILDSRALGMSTTLAAVDVDEASIEAVASQLHELSEVTHSYLREGHPNIWFTLVAPSRSMVDQRMSEIGAFEGVSFAAEFPAIKIFKIGVKVDASSAPEKA